jgi:hypothetical protein
MRAGETERPERSRTSWLILTAGFSLLLLAGQGHAQERIDLRALVRETQITSNAANERTMVWWLPEQFWQASLRQGKLTGDQVDEFLKVVRRYTLIAVVDGRVGPFGGMSFNPEEAVRANVTLKDATGVNYAPLGESSIDPDMKNLIQAMKPIAANMLGPIGQNMHFVLFPAKSDDGRLVADAASNGTLWVNVGGKEFRYRLPLGSLLAPKYDPGTGETFPGNYKFSPFTGTKLSTESPNKPLQSSR